MTNDPSYADWNVLREAFANSLETSGPRATLTWLTGVLAAQSPGLRSSNSHLVAYTGCPEAIDWLEANVASPVTEHWGSGAALLGTPWPRIAGWLAAGGARQLMGLDALIAYRAPAPNMAPLEQIAAPVLPEAPTREVLEATLAEVRRTRSTPRVRNAADSILQHAGEILARRSRGVAISDLPRLALRPEVFSSARSILDRHQVATTGIHQSLEALVDRSKLN